MSKISRRQALKIMGGALFLSGCSSYSTHTYNGDNIEIVPSQRSFDYYFYGERHGQTVAPAIHFAQDNKVKKAGLEGFIQGRLDRQTIDEALRVDKEADQQAKDFAGSVIFPPGSIGMVQKAIDELESMKFIEDAKGVFTAFKWMFDVSYNSKKIRLTSTIGPKIQYASSLLRSGMDCYGIEHPSNYQEHLEVGINYLGDVAKEVYDQVSQGLQDWLRGDMDNELRGTLLDVKGVFDNAYRVMKREGIIVEDNQNISEDFRRLVHDQRTREWMNYLQDKTPVLLICDRDHTSLAQDIAKEQGKSFLTHR